MRSLLFTLTVALVAASSLRPADGLRLKTKRDEKHSLSLPVEELEPCECGVFMSGQLNRTRGARTRAAPRGQPVLRYTTDEPSLPCGAPGYKLCVGRCLDVIVKHLPKAGPLICSSLERDCRRERAHLYISNCDAKWTSTNFSAGKEFCCRGGEPVPCADL